ncbi:MAG: helix-turn-helix domain-containing protein [Verrucomicrobiales bacterium]
MNQYHHLSRLERSRIGIWKKEGHSLSEIGRRLGRAASTISRELKRGVTNYGYCS